MALDPLELATILGILIVLFLWGPQKIPELAKMIGRARKEFDNASREFQNISTSIQNGTSPLLASLAETPAAATPPKAPQPGVRSAFPQAPAPTSGLKTGDELLIEAARRLGISTQGKTREEIQQEIIAMAQRPPATGDSPPPPDKGDSAP